MPTGLSVSGAAVSNDKRLKINEKQLCNALDVIKKLEPTEYGQTYNRVDQYTPDTPQSHQCGFIATADQHIEELEASRIGGALGDDGKATSRCLNYNVPFTFAI